MNPQMFREYDIRGITGKDMTAADAALIGRGVGTFLRRQDARSITVGRDCRLTSAAYSQELIEGLLSIGLRSGDNGRP